MEDFITYISYIKEHSGLEIKDGNHPSISSWKKEALAFELKLLKKVYEMVTMILKTVNKQEQEYIEQLLESNASAEFFIEQGDKIDELIKDCYFLIHLKDFALLMEIETLWIYYSSISFI